MSTLCVQGVSELDLVFVLRSPGCVRIVRVRLQKQRIYSKSQKKHAKGGGVPTRKQTLSLPGRHTCITPVAMHDLFVRMQLQAAEGDLTKTTKCILEVIGDADAESGRSNMVGYGAVGQGRGKDKGKDANKDRKPGPGPKDTWNSREWGPCRWKSQYGCDGKHFNAKCPKRAEADTAKSRGHSRRSSWSRCVPSPYVIGWRIWRIEIHPARPREQ